MNPLPSWVMLLQALLTPAIGLAVGVVAFLQWRTAHQKVMLDLYDRRISVYNKAQDFYLAIVRNGVHQEPVDVAQFHHVRNEAAFLFGAEIKALLEDFHVAVINMSTHASMAKDLDSDDHGAHVKSSYEYLKQAMAMNASFESAFAPYLRMDQKRVRTPSEWLQDRNRIRKSYGNQP